MTERPDNVMTDKEREISPYDEDSLIQIEIKLSETTEDDEKLTADEQNELTEGPQEPEWASADMPLEQYDPDMAKSIQDEMEELALAEPEPPEDEP